MDYQNVFNAARDGDITELKDILEHKSADEVRALVSTITNRATPLIIACINGHSDVVAYLLEECRTDVEQVGAVGITENKPLYFAALSGHLNIAEILIRHKASLSGTEEFDSPLFAACMNGHLEMVIYLIDHGADIHFGDAEEYTSLQLACSKGHYEIVKYLIECGADVNRVTEAGDTALMEGVRSGNLPTVEILLENGAKNIKIRRISPLLSAACGGNALIVEFFFEKYECTKKERVDALELLGATFADRDNNVRARDYWRRATDLRYEDEAFRLEKALDESPLSSCVATTEFSTAEQLNTLTEDEMEIQALLVRERILGSDCFSSISRIRSRGETYAENGNFERCVQLWTYVLDAEMDESIHKELYCSVQAIEGAIMSTLAPFTRLFYKMISEVRCVVGMNGHSILFQGIISASESALKPIKSAMRGSQNEDKSAMSGLQNEDSDDDSDEDEIIDFLNSCHFQQLIAIAMHLLSLMCKLQPYLNRDEENSLKKAAYKIVHLNPRGINGFTPLHIASFKYSSTFGLANKFGGMELPESTFPSLSVVRLLLEVGACPNARDSSNNTPLHVAAMNRPSATDVFNTLLKQGAHIDLFNNENQTPLQLCDDASKLHIHPLQHQNLQCLSAQEIVKRTIPYKGSVHEKLCEFIELHCKR